MAPITEVHVARRWKINRRLKGSRINFAATRQIGSRQIGCVKKHSPNEIGYYACSARFRYSGLLRDRLPRQLGYSYRGRRVPQTHQTNPQDHPIRSMCLRCRESMSLTSTEDVYPGYQRRTFKCPICGDTTTEWAGVSQASD